MHGHSENENAGPWLFSGYHQKKITTSSVPFRKASKCPRVPVVSSSTSTHPAVSVRLSKSGPSPETLSAPPTRELGSLGPTNALAEHAGAPRRVTPKGPAPLGPAGPGP